MKTSWFLDGLPGLRDERSEFLRLGVAAKRHQPAQHPGWCRNLTASYPGKVESCGFIGRFDVEQTTISSFACDTVTLG